MAGHVLATPGDELTVVGNIVNLRAGPSIATPVVMRLVKGRKLVEIQRNADWIEVGTGKMKVESGWIHSTLVEKIFITDAGEAPKKTVIVETIFELFQLALAELNENIKRETGNTHFINAKDLSNGIIEVTATELWLSSPTKEREDDMTEIFKIWNAAMGDEAHITVFIVDKDGQRRMSMFR